MALKPPHANIEFPAVGEIPEQKLREQSKKLQQNQDFIAKQFPIGNENLARRVTTGETSVKFLKEAKKSNEVEVTHKLGAKPQFVGFTAVLTAGEETVGFRLIERTETKFKFQMNSTVAAAAEVSVTVLWEAST